MNTNIEAVWLVIIPILGILFIAKRIIFSNNLKIMGINDKMYDYNNSFDDVIIYTVLSIIIIVVFYGPSNPFVVSFLMTVFMIGLIIGSGILLRYAYGSFFTKNK